MANLPLRIASAALAALLLLPAAQAGNYAFGSFVAKSDFDYNPYPVAKKLGLCTVDVDVNGAYTTGEPLLLDQSNKCVDAVPQLVDYEDIRLVGVFPEHAIGSMVAITDPDYLMRTYTHAVPHFLRYYDADQDGKFKSKDTLYVDLFFIAPSLAGEKQVTRGDMRLTPFGTYPVGSVVQNGDLDANLPLTEISGAGVGFASTNIVYKAGSAFYVNTDAQTVPASAFDLAAGQTDSSKWDIVVEENDVRLNLKAENPFSDFGTPTFTFPSLQVLSERVVAGQPFQFKVTAKNTGKMAASAAVETYVEDVLVDARGTPTIAPGGTGSVVMTLWAPMDAGTHKLRVGKDNNIFYQVDAATQAASQAAALAAEPAPAPAPETVAPHASKGNALVPGPGVAVVAAALGAALALARRKA